jgi:hypothetical protein
MDLYDKTLANHSPDYVLGNIKIISDENFYKHENLIDQYKNNILVFYNNYE